MRTSPPNDRGGRLGAPDAPRPDHRGYRSAASDLVLPGDRVSFTRAGVTTVGTVVRAAAKTVGDRGRRPPLRLPGVGAPVDGATAGNKLRDVQALAQALLGRHRLAGWTFRFDHAKRRGAACHPGRRLITMAAGYAAMATPEAIEDGLLHEIAHALVGCEHQHDAVWQAKARAIGC